MKILTGAELDGYRRLRDKSVSIRFTTSEKTPEEIMLIDRLLNCFGYLYFKQESELTKDEIEAIDNLDTDLYDKPKTKSQRLRNTLFKNFEVDNKGFSEFKDYYDYTMETIIEHYKKKLS